MWIILKRRPGFARLFASMFVSQAGSKVERIALLVMVYALTQSALWVSFVFAAELVAAVLVGPLVSAWTDTREHRSLMVGADLLRAALVALIPLVGKHAFPVLLLLVFLYAALSQVYNPLVNAVVPDLVTESEVDEANGLMMFAERFAEVIFVGLAGLLVAWQGYSVAFYWDAFTFVLSAIFLLGLPQLLPEQAALSTVFWHRVRSGVEHLWRNIPIRRTIATLFAAAMFGAAENVLGVVLAVSFLKVGSSGFGFMEAVMGLGAVLGAIMVGFLLRRYPRERVFLLSLSVFGLIEMSIGIMPVFGWVLVAYLVAGALNMLFMVPVRSVLQLNTPREMRTRVFAATGAVMQTAILIGTVGAGAAEGALGAPLVFILAGVGVSLVTGWVILSGGLRESVQAPTGA